MPESLRILDFDIENRPLTYLGGDYTTSDITAIAWCWDNDPGIGPEGVDVRLLDKTAASAKRMLVEFRNRYDQADVVTGHYIRMHDLPIINGAMAEHGLPPLDQKMTIDTKLDLVSKGSTFSASQENLSEMLGIPAVKYHMSNAKWREANRLTKKGLALTEERVKADVVQHMALRRALAERGMLGSPKVWRP